MNLPRLYLHTVRQFFPASLAILFVTSLQLSPAADPPGILNHQGRIAVNGQNHDGPGYFKFSLVKDAGGTESILWHHDGTALGTAEPAGELNLDVSKGHYSVLLGDTAAPFSMTAIPASVFAENDNVSLRIWFSTTSGSGFEQLMPDRRIVSVGYALSAQSVMGGGTLLSGGNLTLPATTASTGILYSGSDTLLHSFGDRNFFAGVNAGNLTMTGAFNTANGDSALSSNTTGASNTASGYQSLRSNMTGSNNAASGFQSLTSNTIGDFNVASGFRALQDNEDGSRNTATGAFALQSNIASNNTAYGFSALSSNTVGLRNTASGAFALLSNTTGSSNTAHGRGALYWNTIGEFNTANGDNSLAFNTTGSSNTADGYEALRSNTTGANNAASGFQSLTANTTGSSNVANGYSALRSNTTGNNNIALGYEAGISLTTGDHNIVIGNAGVTGESATIRIGDSDQTRAFIAGDVSTAGAVIPGNNVGAAAAGMIRWTGTDFEGYDGTEWVSLTIPAASAVTPVANMVWIEPGEFLLGSPAAEPDRGSDEDDTAGTGGVQVTTLITQGFWMGKYEVTQQEYLDVIGSNPSHFTGNLNRPVEQVSWFDAQVYCAKLTMQERSAGRLPLGYAYRLPTEAEWEYACRAGTTTAFSYGNDNPPAYDTLGDYGWYSANSGGTPHPVGGKLANPWGVHDMHGNVYEWCQDWYIASYSGGPLIDPHGPPTGSHRVIRGGSWFGSADKARCAYRGNINPGNTNSDFGFRVVLAPGQP